MFKDNLACIRNFVESDDKIRVMWNVGDVGMLGCWVREILETWILEMWFVEDVRSLGCGMLWMWDVRDVECWGCGMWDVGCLPGFWILIYKMPISRHFFINLYVKHSNFYRQLR